MRIVPARAWEGHSLHCVPNRPYPLCLRMRLPPQAPFVTGHPALPAKDGQYADKPAWGHMPTSQSQPVRCRRTLSWYRTKGPEVPPSRFRLKRGKFCRPMASDCACKHSINRTANDSPRVVGLVASYDFRTLQRRGARQPLALNDQNVRLSQLPDSSPFHPYTCPGHRQSPSLPVDFQCALSPVCSWFRD